MTVPSLSPEKENAKPAALLRTLSLWQVTLYGLGTTIGAGIFVLLGATAGQAGHFAPVAFVLAAIVMALSAASYAEFAGRVPLSAGSAAYIHEGFKSNALTLTVGLLVIFAGLVSAAAITIGSTGYIREFIDLPQALLVIIIIATLGLLASWGITESVTLASIITVVEVSALLVIIAAGLGAKPELVFELGRVTPPLNDMNVWALIASAGLLAFFAFIGFEDIATLAEETKRPQRTLPLAILLTLSITALVYFLVTTISVLSVPVEDLAASNAPLSLVFTRVTGMSPALISAVAILATLNGVIIQMIMASRMLYGLANQGRLPRVLASVNPWTHTPLISTLIVVAIILLLALAFPLEGLAEMTSRIILIAFALVNLSLLRLKMRGAPPPENIFTVYTWVPAAGFLSCLAMLSSDLLN